MSAKTQPRCLDCGKFQRYPEQFYEDECCARCYDRRLIVRRRLADFNSRYGQLPASTGDTALPVVEHRLCYGQTRA